MKLVLRFALILSVVLAVQADNALDSNVGPLMKTFEKVDAYSEQINANNMNDAEAKNTEDRDTLDKLSSKTYDPPSDVRDIETTTPQSTGTISGSENSIDTDALKDEIIKQFLLKEIHNPTIPSGNIEHDEKQKVLRHLLSNLETPNETKATDIAENIENTTKIDVKETTIPNNAGNQDQENSINNGNQSNIDSTNNIEEIKRTELPFSDTVKADEFSIKKQSDLNNDSISGVENGQLNTKETSGNDSPSTDSTSIQQPVSMPDKFLPPSNLFPDNPPKKLEENLQEPLVSNGDKNTNLPNIDGLNSFTSKLEAPHLPLDQEVNPVQIGRPILGSKENPRSEDDQISFSQRETSKQDNGEITKGNDSKSSSLSSDNQIGDTVLTNRTERTPTDEMSNFGQNINNTPNEVAKSTLDGIDQNTEPAKDGTSSPVLPTEPSIDLNVNKEDARKTDNSDNLESTNRTSTDEGATSTGNANSVPNETSKLTVDDTISNKDTKPDNNDNSESTNRTERTPTDEGVISTGNVNSVPNETSKLSVDDTISNKDTASFQVMPTETNAVDLNVNKRNNPKVENDNIDITRDSPKLMSPTLIAVPTILNNNTLATNDDLSYQVIANVSNNMSDMSIDEIKSLSDQDLLRKLEENQKMDTDIFKRIKSDPDVMKEYLTPPQHIPYIDPVPLKVSVENVGDPARANTTDGNVPLGVADLLTNNPFGTVARTDDSQVDKRILKSMSDAELQIALITLLSTMNPVESNQINLQPTGYGTFQTFIGDIDLNIELVPIQSNPMTRKKAKDMFKEVAKAVNNIHSKMPPGTDEVIKAVISSTVPGGSEAIAVGEIVANVVKKQKEAKNKAKQSNK